jgi:hypothetical protein
VWQSSKQRPRADRSDGEDQSIGGFANLKKGLDPAAGKSGILLVACRAGWGLALDEETCIRILGECGFLPTGPIGIVNLCDIPDGLNGEETERFLRESGAEKFRFRTREDDQQKSVGV